MSQMLDPTFYRSPAEAIAAPPERLAYVAAYDPAGQAKDAMAVLDIDPISANYGRVVGWSELPTAGNELHHFGWNACSSALCHQGHGSHGQPLERRYLIVPGIRSSRVYVLDTKPDPRNPKVVHTIEAEELARKAGYSRPHTVHCGPGGIFLFNLGGANGNDGPGGVALLDHETFEVIGAREHERGDQFFGYDGWWHLDHDTVITSEWATPSMVENGLDPEDLLGRRFGHHLNFWSMSQRKLVQRVDLGDAHQMVFEVRPRTTRPRPGGSSAWSSAWRTCRGRCGCGTATGSAGPPARSSPSRPSRPTPTCSPRPSSPSEPCRPWSATSTCRWTTAGCTCPAGRRGAQAVRRQ